MQTTFTVASDQKNIDEVMQSIQKLRGRRLVLRVSDEDEAEEQGFLQSLTEQRTESLQALWDNDKDAAYDDL